MRTGESDEAASRMGRMSVRMRIMIMKLLRRKGAFWTTVRGWYGCDDVCKLERGIRYGSRCKRCVACIVK